MKATHSYWVPNTRHAGHWEERAKCDPISPHEELQGRHRNNKCSNGCDWLLSSLSTQMQGLIYGRSSDILMSERYMHNERYSAVVFSRVLSRAPVVEFYVRLEFWSCISLVSVRGWDVDTGWVDSLAVSLFRCQVWSAWKQTQLGLRGTGTQFPELSCNSRVKELPFHI